MPPRFLAIALPDWARTRLFADRLKAPGCMAGGHSTDHPVAFGGTERAISLLRSDKREDA